MFKVMILIVIGFVLNACGGSENDTTSSPKPIYNQAYQENFEEDSIEVILNTAKNAYVLVDPFNQDTAEYIESIKANNNEVGGYISAGTGENWRDDFSELEPFLSSRTWDDWPGEYYVSETTTGIVAIMNARIDKMALWGLDWVEFDNMDWYSAKTVTQYQLALTHEESKNYINSLCAYTKSKGMKCMAKNTVEGFEHFDGVLYESYADEINWWDREGTKDFLREGKLVIINHYNESNCDQVYHEYKAFYNSESISFICEDINLRTYKHYNL